MRGLFIEIASKQPLAGAKSSDFLNDKALEDWPLLMMRDIDTAESNTTNHSKNQLTTSMGNPSNAA
jgi:hypothetical protein